MNIQCIYNGPYGFEDPTDWDAEEFIQAGKRSLDDVDEEGLDEDENSSASRINAESSRVPCKKKRRS